MFISGIFIPLEEMAPWARVLAYVSPLTYAQDLMNHAVLGQGFRSPWLDVARLHHCSRVLGY